MRPALALLLLLVCAAPAVAAEPRIRVDFSQRLDYPSMVGFVHGMDAVAPADDLIAPLRPQLWRGKLQSVPYNRVRELGGRYTYVLSDRWGYPDGGRHAPYENYRAWRGFVGGPSTMAWRRDWISGLLEYCLRWSCQVNVLSWHELEGASIPSLRDHVADVRRTLMDNSCYARLGLREVHVNESVAAVDQYRPGEVLGTMYYLEQGGATASARA